MFNKIAIVGVGLIGGSIGLAVRKQKLAGSVVGICRRECSRLEAIKNKAVDRATLDLKAGIKNADLVILAVPVGRILGLSIECLKHMKEGAILTDVGSTKKNIITVLEKSASGRKVNVIGSHPMAGSDRSGVENASGNLFNGATLILTKTKNTDGKSILRLEKFWKGLGSRVLILSPEKHDKDASLASYLPHIVSFVLSSSQTKDSLKFAAGSLKDTTRVAASDTDLWTDIFLSAREQSLNSIDIFVKNLKKLKSAILKKDKNAIKKFLIKAKKIRSKIKQ
ncbi:MAG: prephenate dehydrogenase [Candidatus Omnitrophota bacterium]